MDTTGAGDLYAAGVLYGLTQGYELAVAGKIGSICAAEVISHYGARPEESLKISLKKSWDNFPGTLYTASKIPFFRRVCGSPIVWSAQKPETASCQNCAILRSSPMLIMVKLR